MVLKRGFYYMSIKSVGKNKFQIVDVVDGYIHNPNLQFSGCSFHINKDGDENYISLRNGKESFLTELSKYNSDNENIFISKDDFDEMKLFLKNPDAYVKAMDELLEKEQQQETEDEIMEERTSEEDYEAQKRDYNPDFDNFNSDDCDSSFFETD